MRRIKTLNELNKAVLRKKSVVCPASSCFSKNTPAAFVFQMPAQVVCNLLFLGLFVYEPKKKASRWGECVPIEKTSEDIAFEKKVEKMARACRKGREAFRNFQENFLRVEEEANNEKQ